MITRRTVVLLGLSQLVCWGITYYLIGVFGELIAADLGWSRTRVYGGFSLALVIMGLASPLVGRLIDRHGGGRVMAAGSLLSALGCGLLALAETPAVYYGAWFVLGLAMRATLYDAAFAALARLGGAKARRPIAQMTLLGGLASTCFWPIGFFLADALGWRGAVGVYAGIALLTLPLHLAIPDGRAQDHADPRADPAAPRVPRRRDRILAAGLYGLIVALTSALNSGLSAHMIAVLSELGLAASLAVTIASLRGIGQSLARSGAEVLFGARLDPTDLNLLATLVLPICFAVGLASGGFLLAAAAFTFFYGAGNGILSITRGTLPLVLFDLRTYGAYVGKLLVPSFILAALAPLAFAAVIEAFGAPGALYLAVALALVMVAAAAGLKALARRPNE